MIKKFAYSLYILNPNSGEIVSHIARDEITIKSGNIFKKDFSHIVNSNNSKRYSENRIILSVKAIGSGKEKKERTTIFL